jgi:hypothetical protein
LRERSNREEWSRNIIMRKNIIILMIDTDIMKMKMIGLTSWISLRLKNRRSMKRNITILMIDMDIMMTKRTGLTFWNSLRLKNRRSLK